MYNDTVNCIKNTSGKPEEMCPTCLNTYLKLNDYYVDIINENDMIAGCIDIVDLVGMLGLINANLQSLFCR